jgi:hypothetical protein
MCLSIAIHRPDDVLSRGVTAGLQWMTVHNGIGYRCGYVRLPAGHPWHGLDDNDANQDARAHGGITFAEPDLDCGKGGADDAWWLGFDCGHSGDAPDPALPRKDGGPGPLDFLGFNADARLRGTVRTQAYVEAECRSLCRQAAAVAAVAS